MFLAASRRPALRVFDAPPPGDLGVGAAAAVAAAGVVQEVVRFFATGTALDEGVMGIFDVTFVSRRCLPPLLALASWAGGVASPGSTPRLNDLIQSNALPAPRMRFKALPPEVAGSCGGALDGI